MAMKRRELVKAAVAAGLAGGAGAKMAEPKPADEPEAAAPGDALRPADLAAADRVAGRAYTTAEHELMLSRVNSIRKQLKTVRAADLDGVEPAFHFDPRLPGTPLPQGKNACRMSRGRAPRSSSDPQSLAFMTVVELSRLIKTQKISSVELTRLYLERLKRYDPQLKCVITLTEERALEQAARADREMAAGRYRGPLHGIPWGAKDLLATKGIRTTWGARPYEHQVLDFDATVVERLDEAGAVLVAKLSMGELAVNDVWFGGMTRNPWNPEEGSSGSSAGSGSATAAGLVGFSIGTETIGSIMSPCVRCGVTGLRPTFGRVSRHGAMALSWTLDKIGPMARGVEDCALVFAAIHGPDGRDRVADAPFQWNPRSALSEIRVGFDAAAFESLKNDAGRQAIYAAVLETLRGMGIKPRPVTLPPERPEYDSLWQILFTEAGASFQQLTLSGRAALLEGQGEGNWPNSFRVGSTVPAVDYLQIMRVRRQLQQAVAEALRDVDVYVTVPFTGPTLFYTNFTGYPSVVTRCGMRDGKPQSVEFIGGLYREAAALRVAHAYEQATQWRHQWPAAMMR
jgi:Asp-tRNA(Asn)/Glu-tRNA(Gln) amidotransferase A subunit family amidase